MAPGGSAALTSTVLTRTDGTGLSPHVLQLQGTSALNISTSLWLLWGFFYFLQHTGSMQLNLQNPINWACFTGLEDNNKVIILMNTVQKSVTLGLLKLTLNKLIYCHSSIGSPVLSTLQHHFSIPVVPPSRAVCMARALGWHGTAREQHSPGNGAPEHTSTTACQVLPGQGCTGTCSFLPVKPVGFLHWRYHHNTGKLLLSWGSSAFSLLSLNELSL